LDRQDWMDEIISCTSHVAFCSWPIDFKKLRMPKHRPTQTIRLSTWITSSDLAKFAQMRGASFNQGHK
jgi:hypothetical protein